MGTVRGLLGLLLAAWAAWGAEPPEPAKGTATEKEKGKPAKVEEIVVTATRHKTLLSNTPGVVQVITRREIEELNPTSTGQLLEYVTGTTVETGTGSGFPKRSVIGLNGLPPYYTLVLVDGVRLLSEHIHTGQNVELIPPRSIERIEIIRGAAAAQYGSDAIGGVVNIITRKCGDTSEVSLGGGAGSYGTREGDFAVLQPLGRGIRFSAFSHRERSDGVPLKAPANRIGSMGYEQCTCLARVEADITKSWRVFGWFSGVDQEMDWQTTRTESELRTCVVGTTLRLAPSLDLFAQVARSKWVAETSEEENELLQPEVHLTWRISDAHTLTWGMDHRHQKFSRSSAENLPTQDTFGAFVQHEWRVSHQFTLMAALRYDNVEDMDSVVSPMVSMVYSPDLPLRLRASVGRGFRAPTPQELYEEGYGHGGRALRFGNPDLRPEYSTTGTVAVELFPGEPFELMWCGYYSEIDDMIVPVYEGPWDQNPSKDVWRRQNIAQAKVCGCEIKARYAVSRNVRLEAGYSHTKSEDEGTGRPLPYDAGSSAFAKAVAGGRIAGDWRWSGFVALRAVFGRSAWNWKPAAGTPPGDPSGMTTKLRDYQKLDAGLSVHYRDRYELYANVENILGQDIENLDDAYTVIDGEPVFMAGFRAKW